MLCALSMVITSFVALNIAEVSAADIPTLNAKIRTAEGADVTSIVRADEIYVDYYLTGFDDLAEFRTEEDENFNEITIGRAISAVTIPIAYDSNSFAYRTAGFSSIFNGATVNSATAGEAILGFNTSDKNVMVAKIDASKPVMTMMFKAKKDITDKVTFGFAEGASLEVIVLDYNAANQKGDKFTYNTKTNTLSGNTVDFVPGAPTPVVTSIDIAGADTVEAEATATYTATVKDADGAEMADETVTWSIKEDTAAATIDAATGVLTAGKPDADTTVTVVATSATKADVSAEKTVTISKYVPPVVDPTIELTAEEGKDSAAGAYTFFYKAVITAGTEAITAADVTITSGKNSRRAFLSADMLANIGGGITFYVGNKTADAGRTFSAVGTVNDIASDAVDYTTPAE